MAIANRFSATSTHTTRHQLFPLHNSTVQVNKCSSHASTPAALWRRGRLERLVPDLAGSYLMERQNFHFPTTFCSPMEQPPLHIESLFIVGGGNTLERMLYLSRYILLILKKSAHSLPTGRRSAFRQCSRFNVRNYRPPRWNCLWLRTFKVLCHITI